MISECGATRPYGGQAGIYDREYRDFTDDIHLYLERLRVHRVREPVIELGCGTGRVTLPLAQAGHRITGLDISEPMLGYGRRRRRLLDRDAALRCRLLNRDVTTFSLRGRHGAILAPFSLYEMLIRPEQRAACVQRRHANLAPGGLLILDCFVPRPGSPASAPAPHRFARTFPLAAYGHVIEKEVEEWCHPGSAVDQVVYRYRKVRTRDGHVLQRFEIAFELARLELNGVEAELEAGGFDVCERFGDYRGRPWRPDSQRCILEAIRR